MKAAISCVSENRSEWFPKTLNLVWSIRAFGGRLSEAQVVVCVVDGCDPRFRRELERLGADVRIVSPVDPVIRYTNKLRMFELEDLDCEVLLALDCDTVVVGDPSRFLHPDAIGLKPVDRNYLSDAEWRRLYGAAGLPLPDKSYRTTSDGEPVYPYFNSGVVAVPVGLAAPLAEIWRRYVFHLIRVYARDSQLALWKRFNDQLALSCALIEGGFRVNELPVTMNFPTHVRVRRSLIESAARPFIIHYHGDLDERGFLVRARYDFLNEHIERFNRARSDRFSIPYEGLAGPPRSVRVRRFLADHRVFQSRSAERTKQSARRLLARMGAGK
jgi:hypothetical protein